MTDPAPLVATVLPETPTGPQHTGFDYEVPLSLRATLRRGHRVVVPLGRRRLLGYVIDFPQRPQPGPLRPIEAVYDEEPVLVPHLLAAAPGLADALSCSLLDVVRAMLPPGVRATRPVARRRAPTGARRPSLGMPPTAGEAVGGTPGAPDGPAPAPPLEPAQAAAVAAIAAAITAGSGGGFLLHGVTGSGKTEVYLAAIDLVRARGQQALVLVPEISLTPQTVRRFAARLPGAIAVLHSALTEAERAGEWRRIRSGAVQVVIGSRSAVFAPLPALGLVVVDEEDSTAYKQDRVPRYHAVDVARRIAGALRIPVVLGSATPRLETFYEAHRGGLQLLTLARRYRGRPMPPIEVVDLRVELAQGNRSPFSGVLEAAVDEALGQGGQVILFLNRRGTFTVVLCRQCGEAVGCPQCSVSLVYHAGARECVCHYCGHRLALPERCPACGGRAIKALGMGTERLEAEVRERWPRARLLRMDRDTVAHRDAHFALYETFRAREADLMIGTQMVAKGWDLPGVQVVGIVNADTALHFPDYRAAAGTFSLLTQVAGRAGRGDEPARVILQTYSPDHPAVRHATDHDYVGFARAELRTRRALRFPPYSRLCVLTHSDADPDAGRAATTAVAERLRPRLAGEGIEVLGPSPAFLHRLRGLHRWELTLRGLDLRPARPHLPSGRGWTIDLDPAW